ncbi:MAG: OmpA family protein [Winogradskyella sp.]|uniref:OmpA family protein n=1 Tax=Winogradskyella sp. TaxID=1883156 RepID=UPI00385FB08C
MKQLILILFIFYSVISTSQNLVLNPSFEAYNRCPWHIGRFAGNVKDWSIPNLGTTDFFSFCSETVGYKNYNGFQTPKEGRSYAGFYLFSPDNYREYIQGKLREPLQLGKRYKLTFYISLAENSTDALKNIEVLFTEEFLGLTTVKNKEEGSLLTNKKRTYRTISKTYIKPQKYAENRFRLYTLESETFYNDRENWMKVSLEFEAEGYEIHFSIGNFNSNKKIEVQEILRTAKARHQFAYYYIDDISIESIEKEEAKEIVKIVEEPIIKTNEVYSFKHVLFNFDKAELLEVSIEELDQLYNHLSENTNLKIEIYGHTDNTGLETRNQELSEQRAKAVADYLISQGLDIFKIKSFGFGSSKPISDNKTEEGRQENRRVEFKLINS